MSHRTFKTMNEAERKNLLHKIQSLLAKQGAGGSTPEEEFLAGEIAKKMMDRYEVYAQDLLAALDQRFITHYIDMGRANNSHPISLCMSPLGEYCDIRCWYGKIWSTREERYTVHRILFGRARDVKLGAYLVEVILRGMDRELLEFKESYDYESLETRQRTAASRSFLRGTATRVQARLIQMIQDRKVDLQALTESTTLIKVKQEDLDRLVEEKYGKLKPATNVEWTKNDAFRHGFVAGRNIQIVPGVTANAPTQAATKHTPPWSESVRNYEN